jgi:hypothetical protein
MRLLKTENRKILVDELNISDAYQRTIIPARVKRIANNLDQDAFGSLTVGQRSDGTFWVVDGMQRLTAARKLGVAMVPCDIFQSDGQGHEARVFRLKNKERTNVTACSLFRAQLVEGDLQTVAIKEIVEAAGLRLRFDNGAKGWPYVKAVVALESSYRRVGANGLRCVLDVISKAWHGESEALRGDIIGGVAWFLKRNEGIDIERLVDRLSKKSVSGVIRAAEATFKLERDRSSSSGNKAICTCFAIEFIYSHGLRKKKGVARSIERTEDQGDEQTL